MKNQRFFGKIVSPCVETPIEHRPSKHPCWDYQAQYDTKHTIVLAFGILVP